MSDDEPVLGIDLGTTNSVVSIYQKGNARVIQNDNGNKIIPSFIAFENENIMLIGEEAKNKLGEKGVAVIYDVKRLIGRTFDDPIVSKDKQNWPFKIEADKNNKPIIVVNPKKDLKQSDKKISEQSTLHNYSERQEIPTVEKKFSPEEISSYILKKLKTIAEADLGKKVKKAVITVPAYFNNSQRESTKIAAELAGLEVLRLINEPTAAALAYGLNEFNDNNNKNILIFDLGGGTFDVTILSLEYDDDGKKFEVESTDGDTHLGGQDFDQEFYKLANEKFALENNDTDLEGSLLAKIRVNKACEEAKKKLSEQDKTTTKLEKVYLGANLEITFTKDQLEELCKPYFEKCLKTVDNALKEAKLKENEIDFIVLIGGSTRIPYVRNMLENKFKNSKLCHNIDPDEAVSIGAAIQAAIIVQKEEEKIKDVCLFDVTPLSLGIEIIGERMDIIIKRNTQIPILRKKTYQTSCDNQNNVLINVYEGENQNIKKNHLIGHFQLLNLPLLPAGKAKIEVTFKIDENNILNVSAVDASNVNNNNEITILNDTEIISKEEREKIIKNIHKYEEYEKNNQFHLLERRSLKKDIIELGKKIQNSNDKKIKYNYHKILCKSYECFMKSFKLDELGENEAYLTKFNFYLTKTVEEYDTILSYGDLVDEEVLKNIRDNLYKYVPILIKFSKVSVHELLEKLFNNRKLNDFCCLFRIEENYTQGNLLYRDKEFKQAGKCFSNILQEAAIHDLDTQLTFIPPNSQDKYKNYVSDAELHLKKFDIQNRIDEADKLFKDALKYNILYDKTKLLQSLDAYNYAIQLNRIENKNGENKIIDKYKYDLCVYKINEILIHYLGEKNDKMKNLLEQLQKNLKIKNEYNEQERKKIEEYKKDNKNLKNEDTKYIRINNPNLFKDIDNAMNNINKDIINTAKEFIKLILRDSPYPGYKNEYNDKKLDEIFNKGNAEIKRFINKLKIKYFPDKYGKNIKEQHQVAQKITAHLNDIFDRIDN